MSCNWFREWIEEVKARLPRLKAKLNEIPAATLRDWEGHFVAKRVSREEAFAAIPTLALSPPFADRLAEKALALIGDARKAQAGERGISPADRPACPLGCSSGWLAIPDSEAPVAGTQGFSIRCECNGGIVMPQTLEAIRADRQRREERGAEVLRSWGIDPYTETSGQLGRAMWEALGGRLKPAPVALAQFAGEDAA